MDVRISPRSVEFSRAGYRLFARICLRGPPFEPSLGKWQKLEENDGVLRLVHEQSVMRSAALCGLERRRQRWTIRGAASANSVS